MIVRRQDSSVGFGSIPIADIDFFFILFQQNFPHSFSLGVSVSVVTVLDIILFHTGCRLGRGPSFLRRPVETVKS